MVFRVCELHCAYYKKILSFLHVEKLNVMSFDSTCDSHHHYVWWLSVYYQHVDLKCQLNIELQKNLVLINCLLKHPLSIGSSKA